MLLLYRLLTKSYFLAIRLAGTFNSKARKWTEGRKGWRKALEQVIKEKPGRWMWMHCASLGEFEQGRPILEQMRKDDPDLRILLTFFSPSGYEIRKNYAGADHVMYMPPDTPANARDFLDLLRPEQVFIIKYEIWVNFLLEIRRRKIPAWLISARLSSKSSFVSSPMKDLFREAFTGFRKIFAQDEVTKKVLDDFLKDEVPVNISGDTRYDRVQEIADGAAPIPEMDEFCKNSLVIVAGSSYPHEEELLLKVFQQLEGNVKMVFAPHNIHAEHIRKMAAQSPVPAIRWSEREALRDEHRILWIDNIGMLSRLYRYAHIAWIGGGFGKNGIHNILEAVVYGCPVLFGPNYEKTIEAHELLDRKGAFSVSNEQDALSTIQSLIQDKDRLGKIRQENRSFIRSKTGATQIIMDSISE